MTPVTVVAKVIKQTYKKTVNTSSTYRIVKYQSSCISIPIIIKILAKFTTFSQTIDLYVVFPNSTKKT